jgi:PAS domain S-box-containing protein
MIDPQEVPEGNDQRLAAILDALGEAVTIRGRDDRLIYANQAALDRLGFACVEDLRNADPRALMGDYEITGEQGQQIDMDDLPSVRLLRGEQPEPLLLHWVNRASGEERWALLKAAAVRDADGSIDAAVTVIEDVTASRRRTMRLEFLAHTTNQVLASSLDYQETLRNVTSLAVPQIADWCAVDLFTGRGGRESVAVAHTDPGKLAMAERLRAFDADELDPERGLGRVRRTGESLLFREITDELLVNAAIDPEHLELLRAVGMRSALIVPMTARGGTIGALTMVSAESGRALDESDVEFAEQIARRAGLLVENARLYAERSEVARTLQSVLLPEALPEIPGWEVATLYRPAGQGTEVGGDFYDFWQVDGEWLMMIGDVTGKGVGAATLTSLVRHTARAASDFDPRPARILDRVDIALKREPSISICTALCVRFSEGRGTIAAGGHPLPLCLSAEGVRQVGRPGTLLGAFDQVHWPETQFELQPGETLVGFTDGVTDTVGANAERFGLRRLQAILDKVNEEGSSDICQRLAAALEGFQVGEQADDKAAVFMRFTGAGHRAAASRRSQSVASAHQMGDRHGRVRTV